MDHFVCGGTAEGGVVKRGGCGGVYLQQPEGGGPAGPALFVFGTQHLQLLALAPRLAGLEGTAGTPPRHVRQMAL